MTYDPNNKPDPDGDEAERRSGIYQFYHQPQLLLAFLMCSWWTSYTGVVAMADWITGASEATQYLAFLVTLTAIGSQYALRHYAMRLIPRFITGRARLTGLLVVLILMVLLAFSSTFTSFIGISQDSARGMELQIQADVYDGNSRLLARRASAMEDALFVIRPQAETACVRYEQELQSGVITGSRGYARLQAREIRDTLVGSVSPTQTMRIPLTRGPLKERTLNVNDVDFEDFLINDAEFVLNRYARTMSAETELTRKFGRADMRDQIGEIKDEYADLRAAAKSEKERKRLDREERIVVKNLEAARDMVRGTHLATERATPLYRAIEAAKTFNYVRALGDVVASSLTDVFKITMANGLMPVAREALVPMIRNLKQYRASARDVADLAGIAEPLLNSRMMAIAEITDPYARRTPAENFIEQAGAVSSKLSGMMHWNQFLKEMDAYMLARRFRDGKVGKRTLNRLRVTDANKEMLLEQMKAYGEKIDGVFVPNTHLWTGEAQRLWGAVTRAHADASIVSPTIGDRVPVIEENWLLKPAAQFKSFALSSHRKTLMVGLAEHQTRFLQNALLMASMGMFVYWLKSLRSTSSEPSDNPGVWLAEGIDRSGVVPLAIEMNNMYEGMGGAGLYAGLGSLFGDAPERASRYQVRNATGQILGPTGGMISDIGGLVRSGLTGEFGPGEVGSARRLIPFGNHPGIKDLLNQYIVPEARDLVE